MKEEKNTPPYYVVIGIIAALLVVGGIVYYSKSPAPEKATPSNEVSSLSGNIIEGEAIITEEEVVQAPDFTRPLVFSDTTTAEVRELLQRKFNGAQDTLNENATDFNAWVTLGTLRKTVGDYAGAADDWDYVAKLYPNSTIPFDNLGDLYLNFLKNYPQAEANFKASIAFNPGNIHAYQQLFALYTTYGYKSGTTAAADLIAEGLKANPGNETLLLLKQQLETGVGE